MRKKSIISVVVLLIAMTGSSFGQSGWIKKAEQSDKYFPVTMGNGMIGISPSKEPLQFENVIMNGVYDVYGDRGGVSNIIQGINFGNLDIVLNNKFRLSEVSVSELQNVQYLDMKNATFHSSCNFAGAIEISSEVLALRNLPYNGLVNVELKALSNVNIRVENSMDIGSALKFCNVDFEQISSHEGEISLSTLSAVSPTGKEEVVASTSFLFPKGDNRVVQHNEDGNLYFELVLKKGETFSFSLIGATCSTAQFQDPFNEAKRLAIYAFLERKSNLLSEHKKAWEKLWGGDIEIEGNIEDQLNVRFALYNLYSFVREGTSYSISPMGLSGTGFNGHIFWDCETWMFPPLLIFHPELAKSLLEYRFERLEAARRNAFSHGYDGVMFPWESAETGGEETPVWALTGPFEHHISSDIAIAFWDYYLVTKDEKWLKERAYPVLKEVSDFWVSRCDKNEKGEYEINNVVCADEWAENVDNNAFTNGGAILTLKYAIQAASMIGVKPNPMWKEVADNIPIRYFEDGTIREYEGYDGDKIKQADVNLLTYPLGIVKDKETIKKNLDYYSSKVNGGPAMTHVIYSIIANRLGEVDRSYDFFIRGHRPNLRPPFGVLAETETSNNPYFATAAGGMLQAVINGFGGVEISDDGIVFRKSLLPKEWKSLKIKGVGISKETIEIHND